MGSVREDIAEIITESVNESFPLSSHNKEAWLIEAAQILSLVCKRIEGVENPYKDESCNSYTHLKSDVYLYVIEAARDCFEESRQSILDVIKGE